MRKVFELCEETLVEVRNFNLQLDDTFVVKYTRISSVDSRQVYSSATSRELTRTLYIININNT